MLEREVIAKHRKERQNVSAFAAALAVPKTGSFQMPAPGRVALRSLAGCATGTTGATVGGDAIKVGALVAGAQWTTFYIERGVTVQVAAGFKLLLDKGLGRYAIIAGA